MYYVEINDGRFLLWYRGKNIKLTKVLEQAKTYATERSAKNALSKISQHGFVGVIKEMGKSDVVVDIPGEEKNAYIQFWNPFGSKEDQTYLGEGLLEYYDEEDAMIMTETEARKYLQMYRKQGREVLMRSTMTNEEICKWFVSNKVK